MLCFFSKIQKKNPHSTLPKLKVLHISNFTHKGGGGDHRKPCFADYLKNHKNDCEEAVESVENINTVRMKINDKVGCEFKKVIDEGSNSKHESSLAKKGTAM